MVLGFGAVGLLVSFGGLLGVFTSLGVCLGLFFGVWYGLGVESLVGVGLFLGVVLFPGVLDMMSYCITSCLTLLFWAGGVFGCFGSGSIGSLG